MALAQLPPLKPVFAIPRMAKLVQEMIKDVLDAYTEQDADKAMAVWQRDEEVDEMYTSLFRELLTYMMEDQRNITPCDPSAVHRQEPRAHGRSRHQHRRDIHFLVRDGRSTAPGRKPTPPARLAQGAGRTGWRPDAMNPTILVVEDETALVTLLRYNLEREGFRVAEAGDGEEALLVAREQKPDLVLLDWMLPQLSGMEVCRQMRAHAGHPRRADHHADRARRGGRPLRGLDIGADDYVTKPFSPRELIARVRAVLRRSRPSTNGETMHSTI